LARQQIASLRGKVKASFDLAVDDIRRRGCTAAGVRLAGAGLSGVCRLDLYGAWRLLTVFEAPDRCILLLIAEHTRSANPYQLLYVERDLRDLNYRSSAAARARSRDMSNLQWLRTKQPPARDLP
jgi:hypothetical protein